MKNRKIIIICSVFIFTVAAFGAQKRMAPKAGEKVKNNSVRAPSGMVSVPAGEFMMGCNDKTDKKCLANEKPYHKVYLDAFFIDKNEVTNADYNRCVIAKKCSANIKQKGFTDPRQPVVGVNWDRADAYCKWAGKRLPTEAEWEKAARGTDGRTYPWGENIDCLKANYGDCGYQKTKPVGSYPKSASPYGAMDMAGNVSEWVADWYDDNYYQKSPPKNPTGPELRLERVLRGGAWNSSPEYVRASIRGKLEPDDQGFLIGFRCAK